MTPQRDCDRDPLLDAFADEMRFRRQHADLSRNKLATALGCTPQWIGKVESTEKPPSEAFAQDLDTFFDTGGLFHRQWRKIKEYRQNRVLMPGFPRFVELEAKATLVRAFTSQVVPGLLQTEGYMRPLMAAAPSRQAVDQRVTGRLERQTAVFDREDPPQAWFVLDEAVLRRIVGGPAIMRAQLARLRDIADSPNVHIHILPFESVTWAGLDGMFTTLTIPDGTEIAYHEGPGVNQLTQDPATVHEHRVRFDLVMGESYPRNESRRVITEVLEGLG